MSDHWSRKGQPFDQGRPLSKRVVPMLWTSGSKSVQFDRPRVQEFPVVIVSVEWKFAVLSSLVESSEVPYAARWLSIDYARRRVTLAGEPVELMATEYAVLYQLAVQAPKVLTRSLLQRVWGPERVGEGWLLRNVVQRLRRKLGDDAANPRYIFTEPRVGYR